MSNKGGNKLLGLKREHREADEYREESEGETENPKKDQEKTDLTKSIQSTPTIKKIKINVRDKKSSASIKSSTLESEIIQNVPFSVNEEPIQKVEEKIPQEKENQTNEHNENEEVKLNKNGKKEEKPTSFLFSNNNGSSLFSGSLFSNNANKNSLFGSSSGSSLSNLFSNLNKTEGGSLFNFSNLSNGGSTFFNKKNESDEEGSDGEKDNENEKRSDSPEVYRPTTEKSTGPYTKKYVKLVESFFVYNKKDKKYLSKGDGYFSIEYSEEPKKSAVFVFRNKMGNKMFDGFLSASLDKVEKTIRNFKHIVVVSTIHKGLEGFEGTYLKVPFAREEDLNEFETVFKDVISLLKKNN